MIILIRSMWCFYLNNIFMWKASTISMLINMWNLNEIWTEMIENENMLHILNVIIIVIIAVFFIYYDNH